MGGEGERERGLRGPSIRVAGQSYWLPGFKIGGSFHLPQRTILCNLEH